MNKVLNVLTVHFLVHRKHELLIERDKQKAIGSMKPKEPRYKPTLKIKP